MVRTPALTITKIPERNMLNPRIKQLAEQAGSTHKQSLGVYQFYSRELEKFAELIVQECISICDGNGEYKNHTDTLFGQGFAEGIRISKAQIQQHFGVEE